MALRLLLARHGQTEWNLHARLQGQTDTALSELGERQARALSRRLEHEAVRAVYASDLQRAWRTAELAVAGYGLPPVVRDPAWRELSFGVWEGLTYDEVTAGDPALAARRLEDPADTAPPGGETLSQLAERLLPAAERLRAAHDGETVLVVTHGGPLRVLACALLGLDFNHAWRLQASNGGLSCVRWYEALPVIELWNDALHLRGL
jgi:broad specificity phosphatase PhoE